MSTNPEPSAEKDTNSDPAYSAKPAEKIGFAIFGSLPSVGANNTNSTPMPADKKEDKATPPESTKPACQAATTEASMPLVQATKQDKVKPVMDNKSVNEAAPVKPVVATNEGKTTTPANAKPAPEAKLTKNIEPLIQSVTVDKVKPTAESKPTDEVAKKSPEAKPMEAKKTQDTKPAEKPKTKTPQADDGKRNPDSQGEHSLGGESANQFTPPLPDDFLKKAQANIDASKHYIETSNGSNIGSRVNSQIPSSRSLENKTEDLLLAPIIPRPKKRPAAKSLLKQLGQSHLTRPLKKVKSVKAKTEKPSPGRAKSTGRGRGTQSKIPAQRGPSAKMLSEGPPTEDLEGGWPEGWVKRVFERASGATKGSTDKYWYSPINGIKLRSIVEVRRFMKALEITKGDENEAKKIMKTIKL